MRESSGTAMNKELLTTLRLLYIYPDSLSSDFMWNSYGKSYYFMKRDMDKKHSTLFVRKANVRLLQESGMVNKGLWRTLTTSGLDYMHNNTTKEELDALKVATEL